MRQALIKGSKTDEWYTPLETVKTMLKVFIYGINDWLTKDYEYDYLITNPPYSNKDEIIERCIESGKPCVLVLPIESLGGVKRHALYKKTNIAIYVPTKRIKFISEDGEDSKAPAHHSIVMLINAKRTEIIFEHELER